jgi:DNA ligase-1
MLAGKCTDITKLKYPVLATPKLDGIRCLVIKGRAVSRKFKPIPNDYIRQTIETCHNSLELDGEIMIPNRTFNELSGDVRRIDGRPTNFEYHVFDYIKNGLSKAYADRVADLVALQHCSPFVKKVIPVAVDNPDDLTKFEEKCLVEGFEGIMVRSFFSPYKCGRSTENEGYLLKIKRFEDEEACVIGYEELMHNDNVATQDAFGRTERSSHQENLRGAGVLGKLECRRISNQVDFGIGTGFDAKTRAELWAKRDQLIGKVVKFKHQPSGADERPRFPVFLGFRDEWDT